MRRAPDSGRNGGSGWILAALFLSVTPSGCTPTDDFTLASRDGDARAGADVPETDTGQPGPGSADATNADESDATNPESSDRAGDARQVAQGVSDAADTDAGDAVAPCVLGPFGTPELITVLNLTFAEWVPSLSADNHTLYFGVDMTGANEAIYTAMRPDRGVAFSTATAPPNFAKTTANGNPDISFDGLTLYFYSNRPGGLGAQDLYFAMRPSQMAPFGAAQNLTSLNSTSTDHLPWVSEDELTILFVSTRSGQSDIWMATRASKSLMFSSPIPVPGVNTSANQGRAAMSSDGLTIYFSSDRMDPSALGGQDFWSGTRPDANSVFSNFVDLTVLNTPEDESDISLSYDQREVVFSSSRGGSPQLWRSIRSCQ